MSFYHIIIAMFIRYAIGGLRKLLLWLVTFHIHIEYMLRSGEVPPCLSCSKSTEFVYDKRHLCPAYSRYCCS